MIAAFLLAAMVWPEPLDPAEAKGRVAMFQYADCIARQYRDLAVVIAEVDPNRFTMQQKGVVQRPDCLVEVTEALKVDPTLFRFAITEALLHRAGREAPNIAGAVPIAHPIIAADAPMPADWVASGGLPAKWPESRDSDRRFSVVSALGDCVVRADPARSWTVLRTKLNSDQELAAMTALTPVIAGCLPAGQQMPLTKNDIRGMVALDFYLLSKAPRVASGVAK